MTCLKNLNVSRESLHGHRYMATGNWPTKDQQKAPRSFLHLLACFRLFSPVFALFRSFSLFLGCLVLTFLAVPFRTFSRLLPVAISIPLNQKFRKEVGGQRGLAQGDPSHTINSGLFSAPFFPMPP